MSPVAVIILIIVIVVVLAAIVLGVQRSRRRKLQNTFGPEYDRVVADTGSRADAEKELRDRERRHAELELKPLSPESQARYSAAWEEVQIQFVDNPEQAVTTADDLVTRLIGERGYPTGDYDDQLANLSVEHARTLGHYRDAHEINLANAKGEATTEQLRQAVVHYRELFSDLLGTPRETTTEPSAAAATTATETVTDRTSGPDADRTDRADADADRADRYEAGRVDEADRADRYEAGRVDEADLADTDRADADRYDADRAGRAERAADRADQDEAGRYATDERVEQNTPNRRK
jgi:hypothetical protein